MLPSLELGHHVESLEVVEQAGALVLANRI